MSLYYELKRRNVFRVAVAYLALAWLLTEVAGTMFPLLGIPGWAFQLLIMALAFGLIPTLAFSWAYELTPSGLKREKEVVRDDSISQLTAKRLDGITIGLIILALAFILTDGFWLAPEKSDQPVLSAPELTTDDPIVLPYSPNSIAVLPFVNMSEDQGNEYFSDGISEELINLLTKVPELRVTSRSSTFNYKNRDIKIPDLAEELKVNYVLEGSVRKAGDRVRVTSQLIHAPSDSHMWSASYERTLDDIFAIQDNIAQTVVEQLKVQLLNDAPRVETTDPDAYTLYLQALHLGTRFTAASFEQSNALYQQALAIDPGYAQAWSSLAGNYINQITTGQRSIEEGMALARDAANRALELDPNQASALAHLSIVALRYDRDFEFAARHLDHALMLEPANTVILRRAATLNRCLGRLDEAIQIDQYVVDNDPVNPVGYYFLGFSQLVAGHLDDAILSLRKALVLSPDHVSAHYRIGEALYYKGELDSALEAMLRERGTTKHLMGQAMIYHALGDADASGAAMSELVDRHERTTAYNIAYLSAFRGDADGAFSWLEKAVQYNDSGLPQIAIQPEFKSIHDDPRWLPFLERIGASPDQRDAIEFEVILR